jgi:uncharacterized membrane protein (UPF0136 family)
MANERTGRYLQAMRLLLGTAWVGITWAIGYVVAPTLFTHLERTQAGTLAGHMFRVEALVSLVVGVVLLFLFARAAELEPGQRKGGLWLVALMLGATLIGYYGLQPFMAELRAAVAPGGVMEPDAARRFGMLHGASSLFYLFKSLAGIWLVLRLR